MAIAALLAFAARSIGCNFVVKPPTGMLDGGILDPTPDTGDPLFTIKALGSRCVDVTQAVAGAPVVLRTCNAKSTGQRIAIREVDPVTHDVQLGVGTYCFGVDGKGVELGARVVLQACTSTSPSQRFAIDGDAILVGRQGAGERVDRNHALRPQSAYTADGTPLVVGPRELSDAEYFFFLAVDGSKARPHRGFVTVANEGELDQALSRGWGTVIEVSEQRPLEIAPMGLDGRGKRIPKPPKIIHEGVTLRGNRIRTNPGAEVRYEPLPIDKDTQQTFLSLGGHEVRITGLRLTGSSDSIADNHGAIFAVVSESDRRLIVDRNEMTLWTGAAVRIVGTGPTEPWPECMPSFAASHPVPRVSAVRVVKNSLHNNQMYGYGYGVYVQAGTFPFIQANVAYSNRHTIASDGHAQSGYAAFDNLVLSKWPDYPNRGGTSDFDIHGDHYVFKDPNTGEVTGEFHRTEVPCFPNPGSWMGGLAGDYLDIGWNTFLGTNRINFYSRGTPCRSHEIHDNVFMRPGPGSPICLQASAAIGTAATDVSTFHAAANSFAGPNPTDQTAAADFDGDGVDDVFLGTGTGWFFSSGARSEWRFLSRKSETASKLRFGDFDGDGRADVVTLRGAEVVVSWAGISDWQAINVTAGTLDDLAVGDFDGDRVADLFYANGSAWYVAPRGRSWAFYATSDRRTRELRFGDFTQDGRTDVLGMNGGKWSLVTAALGTWTPLGAAHESDMRELIVGDFDGDGIADVGRFERKTSVTGEPHLRFRMSKSGVTAFQDRLFMVAERPDTVAFGRFDGAPGVDFVRWNGRQWSLAPSSATSLSPWSRQDMR